MIVNNVDRNTGVGFILVRTNLSAKVSANVYAVLIVVVMAVISNMPWIIIGLWVPAVYCIIDIAMLILVLWMTRRACRFMDVIRLYRDRVVVEQGHGYPESVWSQMREWTTVQYWLGNAPGVLPEVGLVSSGDCVIVGKRVNYVDRKRLLRILKRYLPHSQQMDHRLS